MIKYADSKDKTRISYLTKMLKKEEDENIMPETPTIAING